MNLKQCDIILRNAISKFVKKKEIPPPWETPLDQSIQKVCEVLFTWEDVSKRKEILTGAANKTLESERKVHIQRNGKRTKQQTGIAA